MVLLIGGNDTSEVKEKNDMAKVTTKQLVKLVALEADMTIAQAQAFLDGLEVVVKDCVLSGYDVTLGDIGIFKIGVRSPREQIVMKDHAVMGGDLIIPASEAYNNVLFKPSKGLKTALREKTLGNIYVKNK